MEVEVVADSDTSVTQLEWDIQQKEGLLFLQEDVEDNSVDLILTDPPYIISRDSGMNTHYNNVKKNEEAGGLQVKTEEQWNIYKTEHCITDDTNKDNYMNYGSIYGKKYCVKTDYGDWDSQFTMERLDKIVESYYKKLKKGGTMIMFFDLWKLSQLKRNYGKT